MRARFLTLVLLTWLIATLVGCIPSPPTTTTVIGKAVVDLSSVTGLEGCKLYTVQKKIGEWTDTLYITRCSHSTVTSYTCGKSCKKDMYSDGE